MPRSRRYATNAERQAAYRARLRARRPAPPPGTRVAQADPDIVARILASDAQARALEGRTEPT